MKIITNLTKNRWTALHKSLWFSVLYDKDQNYKSRNQSNSIGKNHGHTLFVNTID